MEASTRNIQSRSESKYKLSPRIKHSTGAPNENIVQNHLNVALLNEF